jgi:hypothetical protein
VTTKRVIIPFHLYFLRYLHLILGYIIIDDGTSSSRSRDSVVGITTSFGLDDRGVGVPSPGMVKNFLFFRSSRLALRSTQPPVLWVPGALSPGVKRPGREVDHSPPTSAEVKKMRIYISTPHTPSWHSA